MESQRQNRKARLNPPFSEVENMEKGANVTIEFHLQTRRLADIEKQTYTPFRTVYTGDEDAVKMERDAHLSSGYKPDRLRITRVVTVEEVWWDAEE